MELSVTCNCGTRIPIAATACGSTLQCGCGSQVQVPNLSELRRNAGLTAYQLTTAEQLQSLYKRGCLPLEKDCVQCGRRTEQFVQVSVECESPTTTGSRWLRLLGAIMFSMRAAAQEDEEEVAHGNEIVVKMPLRLCTGCVERIQGQRRELIELMRRTELYQQLLTEYPRAKIHVEFPEA